MNECPGQYTEALTNRRITNMSVGPPRHEIIRDDKATRPAKSNRHADPLHPAHGKLTTTCGMPM